MSEFTSYWKTITAHQQKQHPSIFLLRDLIIGRDPRGSSFSMITNKNKLANGCAPWSSLKETARNLLWKLRYKDPTIMKLIELAQKKDPSIDLADRITQSATKLLSE